MVRASAPNHPGRPRPDEKVRRLQRKLYVAAKQQKGRRFHALYDRIFRSDVLTEAWRRVKRNKGAAGVDGITLEAVEQYGVAKLLNELRDVLQAGTYRAPPVLRRYIPKADGKQRPLGIPTVKDRIVQMAAKLVLEPIFEADFLPSSFGFRPCIGTLVRYADDFVVLCRSREDLEEAERRVRIIFERLKLTLHPEKTRKVDLSEGKEGFDFLGCHLHMRMSGKLWEERRIRRYYLQRWPSMRSMKRVRTRVKELTDSRRNGVKDVDVLIRDLNPVLRGWGNYFRTGNAARKFLSLDGYALGRLNAFRWKRHRRHVKPGQRICWTREENEAHGLHRLRGTVRYPKPCTLHRESPPVSRVREIRMHGLKGGGGTRTA